MSERSFERGSTTPRKPEARYPYRSFMAGAALSAASIAATFGVEESVKRDHGEAIAPVLQNEVERGELRSPFAFREHRDWETVGGVSELGSMALPREPSSRNTRSMTLEVAVYDRRARVDGAVLQEYRNSVVRRAPSQEAARQVFAELRPNEQQDVARHEIRSRGVGETALAASISACELLLHRAYILTRTIEVPSRFALRTDGYPLGFSRRVVDGTHVVFVDHPIVGRSGVVAELETHDAVFYLRNTNLEVDRIPSSRTDGTVYQARATADVIYDTGRRWHHE